MKYFLIILTTFFLHLSCNDKGVNKSIDIFQKKNIIDYLYVGLNLSEIPDSIFINDGIILSNRLSFLNSYTIYSNDLKYRVGISDDCIIKYIYTSDTNFKTIEGVKVATSYQSVVEASPSQLRFIDGFGVFIPLTSDWNAVFDITGSNKVDSVLLSSHVSFFFKLPAGDRGLGKHSSALFVKQCF